MKTDMNSTDLLNKAIQVYGNGSPLSPDNAYYDEALVYLTTALENNPILAEAYNLRWHIRYLRKDYVAALDDINQAITIDPVSRQYYYNRGFLLEALRDYSGALQDFLHTKQLALEQGDDDLVDATDHHIPSLQHTLGIYP